MSGINAICNPRKHHLGRVEEQRPKLTILRERSHTTCEKKEGGESQKPEMVRIPRKEFLTFPRGAKGTRQRDIDKGQMQLDKVTTEISKNQIEVSAVTLKQGQTNLCETES